MPIMEISVVPIGTCQTSISSYVAKAEEALKKEKVKSQITAMGTIIEADSLDKLFDIAKRMHKGAFSAGTERVFTTISIDDRLDKEASIESKVKSVRKKLNI